MRFLSRLLVLIPLLLYTVPQCAFADGSDSADNYVAGTGAGENMETDGTGFKATGNTFIGVTAGYADTTGSANVGIGYGALRGLTTGMGNIGIGYMAGRDYTTEQFYMHIGNGFYPSNGIFGILSSGYIGINKSTPTAALDVAGSVAISGSLSADSLSNSSGRVTIADSLLVTKDLTVNGRAYVDSLSNPAGDLVVPDSLNVTGKLTVGGAAAITGAITGSSLTTTLDATIGGRAYVDSISNAAGDLVVPDSLNVTGKLTVGGAVAATGGITGATLGVGNASAPNAKTVMSIYPVVGVQDTLQSWRASLGNTTAWVDSSGNINSKGGLDVTAHAVVRNTVRIADGTAASPSLIWISDTNLGFYRVGPDRLGIAAKGANVAIVDSSGFAVTGGITATGTATFQAFNTPVQAILADSTLTAARSGYTYIARPIVAKATATLPSNPAVGTNFLFFVADADSLRIATAESDSLIDGTGAAWKTTTSVAGWIKATLGLANKWFLTQYNGTWTSY